MKEVEKIKIPTEETKEFAKILQESKCESDLYKNASIALKSYLDGFQAALNCRRLSQAT